MTAKAKPMALEICDRCSQPTIAGECEGFDTRTDPYALTAAGELAALVDGRTTFTVDIHGRTIRMFPRAAWDIPNRRRPVVARHRCHAAPYEFDTAASLVFIDMLTPRLEQTECPF